MGVDEDDEFDDGVCWLDVANNCCVPFDGDWRPPFIIDCWLNKDCGDRMGDDDHGKWCPKWFDVFVFNKPFVDVLTDDDVDVDDDVEFGEFNLLFNRSFCVDVLFDADELIHPFWMFDDAFEEVFVDVFCAVLLPVE